MKSVLISIKPKWCELIAQGKKTVEVRKTKPKIDAPFKCYIYCTNEKTIGDIILCKSKENSKLFDYNVVKGINKGFAKKEDINLKGKVIGEFVCEKMSKFDSINYITPEMVSIGMASCLTEKEFVEYVGNNFAYGWHITDLVIYDKPKGLGEFIVPSKIGCCNEGKCRGCKYLDRGNGFNIEDDCNAKFCTDEYKPLRKAPQSWCYVEELGV